MCARGKFGNDAAEPFMDSMLGGDDVREDGSIRIENCGRSLVTGCLDAEDRT
jgi:hypothetical protein